MRLEVFRHGQLLQEVPLQDAELWIGRDDSCKIKLDDRAISRKHALIRSSSKDGIEFEKVSEFGWIKLNGQDSSQAKLKDGDRLELGSYEIRVSQDSAATATALVAPTVTEIAVFATDTPAEVAEPPLTEAVPNYEMPVAEAAPAPEPNEFEDHGSDGATRIFTSPDRMKPILNFGHGNQYEVADDEVAVGRSQQCHVVLEDKRSSRKHALIKRDGKKYFIKDLGSANGTLLNGERVDEQELSSGDEIRIGDTKFTFEMVQADYETRKQEFISVPEPELPMAPAELMASSHSPVMTAPMQAAFGEDAATVTPAFEAPKEVKKTLIGKFLDRYRAMTTKQQIIYGIGILAGIWFLLDEEPEVQKAKLNASPKKTMTQKKDEKKPGTGAPTFEALSAEQKRYIDAQYQLSFDLYKNREYDKCLLELGKIFSLVQDYKNAREIEAFAREGKRKLEAQEEERKRKEQERQAQLKLQSLIEQVSHLMDQKKYKEAEALFPEIELLQPENTAVSEWRKLIAAESEKVERDRVEKQKIEELHRKAWADFQAAMELVKSKKYYEALDQFDEVLTRNLQDQKLIQALKEQTIKVEEMIAAGRDPFLDQGKQLEKDGKLTEAYRAYQKALEADPMDEDAPAGMKRIKGVLADRAKHIYTEGVFAESYGDIETAEKKYREVLDAVPKESDYHEKAQSKLRKLTVFKRAGVPEVPPQ